LFTPEAKAYLKREIANYKAQRHLLMKDYYPLFDPEHLTDYDGWQFHDPETDEGFFMVFRVRSPDDTATLHLGGLTPGTIYALTDVDTGQTQELAGGDPLPVTIPEKDGTLWCRYARRAAGKA